MYSVKPFKSFDLSDVKLPDTMYSMRPVYNTLVNAGDSTVNQLLDIQTEKLSNLNLDQSANQSIDLVLQLQPTSLLYDYLINLKNELKDQLNIIIYKHSSIDDESIKKWFKLSNGKQTSCSVFENDQSLYNLKIIIKSNEQSSLYKSDSKFKINGEIKILNLLNNLIQSTYSIPVNDLNGLVHKLLADEYFDFLAESLNTNTKDDNKLKYYQNNLQIKSKLIELAEQIYRNQIKN